MGINVITQPDNFGLGEAASYVTPAQINCLAQDGDIIIDVGYGAGGLEIPDILTGIGEEENLQIYLAERIPPGSKPRQLIILLNMLSLPAEPENSVSQVYSLTHISVMKQQKKIL